MKRSKLQVAKKQKLNRWSWVLPKFHFHERVSSQLLHSNTLLEFLSMPLFEVLKTILAGLMENVILGRLIPAGTGFKGSPKADMIEKMQNETARQEIMEG
jgi:hypothetical protein